MVSSNVLVNKCITNEWTFLLLFLKRETELWTEQSAIYPFEMDRSRYHRKIKAESRQKNNNNNNNDIKRFTCAVMWFS